MQTCRQYICIFLFIVLPARLQAQKDTILRSTDKAIYPFIIQDSPARLFTMRQVNEDYISFSRLYSQMLMDNFAPLPCYSVQLITSFLAFNPMTHEEGHRSILTSENIGSIIQPFFLSRRGGYVDGVTDSTLENLRDTKFPVFTRLYTAGLESDYMLTWREETLMAFNDEAFRNLAVEYYLRKTMIMQYYLMSFVHYNTDGAEESNQLQRDIVGNDVYGVIRHLHRPTMPFYRYTRYQDLTPDEKYYLRRVGLKSLVNLADINLLGVNNIKIANNIYGNFAMGYTMCPFGDFIDELFWIKYRQDFKIRAYVREYMNNVACFPATGIGIKDINITKTLMASLDLHYWDQPSGFNFNTAKGMSGSAADGTIRYFFRTKQTSTINDVSFDLGGIYKTPGYLPEEVCMSRHFGVRMGMSIKFGTDMNSHQNK